MISKATAWLIRVELNNECGQIILPENFICAVDLLIQTFMDVPLVECMYLVFTRMPGESYRRRLRSLLCLYDVFRALVNSLVC